MQKFSKGIIHLGVVIATLVVTVGIIIISYFQIYKVPEISSYDECVVAKGSVIQESYPETCVTKDGQSFAHILSEEEQKRINPPTSTPTPITNIQTGYGGYDMDGTRYSLSLPNECSETRDQNSPYFFQISIVCKTDDFEITINPQAGGRGLGDYVPKEKRVGEKVVDGHTWTSQLWIDFDGTAFSSYELIDKQNENNYLITVQYEPFSEKAYDYFDQILSTFEFLPNMSDWKTYKNEEYGFEFQYPDSLKISSDMTGPVSVDSKLLSSIEKPYLYGYDFTVYLSSQTLDTFVQKNIGGLFPSDMKKIDSVIFPSFQANKYQYTIPAPNSPTSYYYVFTGDDKVVAFQTDTAVEADKTANQILSTFKFID